MLNNKFYIFICVILSSICIKAQIGGITISLYDQFSKKALEGKVSVINTQSEKSGYGEISIDSLQVGNFSFAISAVGYESTYLYDVNIVPNQKLNYSIGLINNLDKANEISEVVVNAKKYKTTSESPVSLRNITSEEVQKNAGSNRDISKALLSLPGVANTSSFRNDLLIRGGSSLENKFYIDGIEVPTINHFQTQGASGGPRGIITVDFIRDVDFYSGAFPARRNAVMSSLFEFNFKKARKDKLGYKVVLGIDDMQFMADGPLSKDQSWTGLFSIRKSNLQLLFKAIGLPFLPSYYDSNFKISKKFRSGDELYFLGIGAIDQFKLNLDAEKTASNLALLDRIPVSPQWNYTFGLGYSHLVNNGNWLFTLSRNTLDNKSEKYFRNSESPENLLLDYHSQEIEHKLRLDRNWSVGSYKWSTGINVGYSYYFNKSYNKNVTTTGVYDDVYTTKLNLMQYGAFVQVSNKFFDNALNVSFGARWDASDYSKLMENPLQQFSPRLSMRYEISKRWALNFNTGIYYQLPPFTALGFRIDDDLTNKKTLKYIKNQQIVFGTEYNAKNDVRLTLEGYYKKYSNYPFSLRNSYSLANTLGGYGVVGAEPLDARSRGETYGVEFLAQKRTANDFYGIVSYTFGYSKFSNEDNRLIPSAWDTRHIASVTAGKYFKKNWNVGARFRLQSGFPETPYDFNRSSLVTIWDIANGPIYNTTLLNTIRGKVVHQLDIRVEKKWVFNKWQITAYMDVVNVYGSNNPSNLPVVNILRNADGTGVISNPNAPLQDQKYELISSNQDNQSTLPYLGFIFEF
ncbi:TonB-dependent receptor plug domain-containing protein [Soonwooa purpurea]